MLIKPSAKSYAEYANNDKWIGIPYEQWDCQAFVEQMLKGVGAYYNWRGSNHMWREGVSRKGTLSEMKTMQGGDLLPGTWVFTVKHDGGEIERGYHDNEGNAAHVGIYLGNGRVIHSTTGGVQWDALASTRWTHAGECCKLYYGFSGDNSNSNDSSVANLIADELAACSYALDAIINILRGGNNSEN